MVVIAIMSASPASAPECAATSEHEGVFRDATEGVGYNPYRELNPYGIWEITDSSIAKKNPAPEAEPWPDAPLQYGKRIVITEETFEVAPYPGKDINILHYIAMEFMPVSRNYIWGFRFSPEGTKFFCDLVPEHTMLAAFYEDDIDIKYKSPYREIWFADYDTALYTDYMFMYKLERVESYEVPYFIPFTDVPIDASYRKDVELAYKNYLMNGRARTLFCPDENITYAEAVKIAVCVWQLLRAGLVNVKNSSPVWYKSFMEMAQIVGIILTDISSRANKQITRRDFVNILYNALPESELEEINEIGDGSITDINLDPAFPITQKIYAFCRAGLMAVDDGSFYPYDTITRGEAASILTRIMDNTTRITAW